MWAGTVLDFGRLNRMWLLRHSVAARPLFIQFRLPVNYPIFNQIASGAHPAYQEYARAVT
jgi:hypothetical protein